MDRHETSPRTSNTWVRENDLLKYLTRIIEIVMILSNLNDSFISKFQRANLD